MWLKSEILPANRDWTRLEVSYTNTGSTSKSVTARIQTTEAGTTYLDCVQVEKAPTSSRYNLIQNGDFSSTTFWSSDVGLTTVIPENKVPASQLDTNVYKMTGNPSGTNRLSQIVQVSGSAGDTFVLAGWAKADSVPIRDDRAFALIATFMNGTSEGNTSIVEFNPDADSTIDWQYAASPIIADNAYDSIRVELAYDYNANDAYFDGIQLYKEEFGNSYTYDEEGNIISVVDLQGETTTYEYNDANDIIKRILPSGAELTYDYDTFHNVISATSDTGVVYTFEYDTFGNNTKVSIGNGDQVLTSTADYSDDGNRLEATTDAVGNVTIYKYNEDTNVLESVRYPNDGDEPSTVYSYDSMYRLESATVNVDSDKIMSASYAYTNDLLSSITTASTKYDFHYGAFSLRSNIMIGDRTLATYSYTDRTNYLESIVYGDPDSSTKQYVNYTYDTQGRVIEQEYDNGDIVTFKYDNSGALASVIDNATGITTTYYYDFTDRLLRYAEKGDNYSHIVGYEYDNINNLTALVETINSAKYSTLYDYDADNRVIRISNEKNGTLTSSEEYTYDEFSRVEKRITKHGTTPVLTDTITYLALEDTNTTGLVWKYNSTTNNGYNVTYTYTYDSNGNITSVSDGTYTTRYLYDSANQLIREDNQAAGKTWTWEYDNAGNIVERIELKYTTADFVISSHPVEYIYNDSDWRDLLTTYNGKPIVCDHIGNMTSDGTWNYTWEHGRQLAEMSSDSVGDENSEVTISYTYDSNGLRIGKTVTTNVYGTNTHTVTFIADGVTVCTLEVEDGYTLTADDYPIVPEKSGHTGRWNTYTSPVTSDITIQATYTENVSTHTVTFIADGVTVDTLTVNNGYTLTANDYPAVPEKSGYTGAWNEYTSPITSDITIQAVYTAVETTTTHTVTFRVSYGNSSYGYTVKTMTVEDGYVLTDADYPTNTGMGNYAITWERYTSPITSDITINGTYTSSGTTTRTVTFVADGVTVDTLTVNNGYTLTEDDYPAVPEKEGYIGSWNEYTSPVTSNITIEAVYTAASVTTYTVTFVADGVTVDTLPVNSGYTLTADDYPDVPEKSGYTGSWNQYTSPITSNITIEAVYTENDSTTTHTVTFKVSYNGSSYGYTLKTMAVEHGYVLVESDYPSSNMGSYSISWEEYTSPITSDITVNGTYSWGGSWANSEGASTMSLERSSGTLVSTTVVEYTYIYNGSQLTEEIISTTVDGGTATTETLHYTYDASGTPMAVIYNDVTYYYATNLQGDVVAILSSSGVPVVTYSYNAWGNILSNDGDLANTLGEANALRYRGYVYDNETALYYLRSRYYNPELGRFINADALVATGQGILGNNMFAYCNNNPIVNTDSSGCYPVCFYENPADQAAQEFGHWIAQKIRDRIQQVEEGKRTAGDINYNQNSEDNLRIENSFTVSRWNEIYVYCEYLVNESEYSDFFIGSPEGVFVEWVWHNALVYVPFLSYDSAKDTDVGSSIFAERRFGLNIAMWMTYYIMFPEQYQNDLNSFMFS